MSVLLSQKLWLLVAKRRGKNTLQKTTFLVAAAPKQNSGCLGIWNRSHAEAKNTLNAYTFGFIKEYFASWAPWNETKKRFST